MKMLARLQPSPAVSSQPTFRSRPSLPLSGYRVADTMPPKRKAPIAMPSSLASPPKEKGATEKKKSSSKSPTARTNMASRPAIADPCGYYQAELQEAELRRDMTIESVADIPGVPFIRMFDINPKKGRPEDSDVGLAITCVTEAISQNGPTKFALYNIGQFVENLQGIVNEGTLAGRTLQGFKVCRTRYPLYICYADYHRFSTEGETQLEHDGHYILATAHREKNAQGRVVKKIRYYDSATSCLSQKHDEVFQKTQQALKSNWGNPDGDAGSNWAYEWVPVAQQDTDMCGIHSILNAWTLALGLQPPVQPPSPWARKRDRNEFYRDAARLISCAVHGEVSTDLIMAFFRCWNFLADPDREPPADRWFRNTRGLHDLFHFQMTMDEVLGMPSPTSPEQPAAGGPSTWAAQILGPDQLSTSGGSSNETVYVDSEGDLSDPDSQEEGNPDKKHDHDEEDIPDQGDNSNEEQGSDEEQGLNEQHSRAFWPEGAEKYPCRFLEARLRRASRTADLVKEGENAPDDVNGRFIKLNNRWMWCASIASVTEAISLNGYEQEPYLDSEMENDGIEDRDYTIRDYEEDFTEDQKEDAEDFMAAVKKKQKEHRTEKRVFSFYGLHCLERAERKEKTVPGFGVLRRIEPIIIPISSRHLVYVTPPAGGEPLSRVAHYWVESLESPGLPNRHERLIQERDVRDLLKRLGWGPEPEPEPEPEEGDSEKKKKKPLRNDIWNLVSPVDPNLLLPPHMRQDKEVVHLVLTAWTIALGFRPPSSPVITADHRDLYSKIEFLILRAAQGLVDSATIFAGLRCLGWIPKGVMAPPESVRFDRTMPFGWNKDDMSDYYDYRRREMAKEELQARMEALKGRWDDAWENASEAMGKYKEKYGEDYSADNVMKRRAMRLNKKQREELDELARAIKVAQANEENARELFNDEKEELEMTIAELNSLDDGCRGGVISNDATVPAKALGSEGEESEYGDEWLLLAELAAAKRAFEGGKSRYAAAIENLPITMGKVQDEALRSLHAPDVQKPTAAAAATRPPPQASPRTTPPATGDGGTASAAEDPRGLKRSYEEFADERLVVNVYADEYDELLEIHNSGKGLHRVWPTPFSLFHCFDLG